MNFCIIDIMIVNATNTNYKINHKQKQYFLFTRVIFFISIWKNYDVKFAGLNHNKSHFSCIVFINITKYLKYIYIVMYLEDVKYVPHVCCGLHNTLSHKQLAKHTHKSSCDGLTASMHPTTMFTCGFTPRILHTMKAGKDIMKSRNLLPVQRFSLGEGEVCLILKDGLLTSKKVQESVC